MPVLVDERGANTGVANVRDLSSEDMADQSIQPWREHKQGGGRRIGRATAVKEIGGSDAPGQVAELSCSHVT